MDAVMNGTQSLRKETVFMPCKGHNMTLASEPRYRQAEVMVEGGYPSPCRGGQCRMKPGTDYYTREFVAAHPVYTVEK